MVDAKHSGLPLRWQVSQHPYADGSQAWFQAINRVSFRKGGELATVMKCAVNAGLVQQGCNVPHWGTLVFNKRRNQSKPVAAVATGSIQRLQDCLGKAKKKKKKNSHVASWH
jgi:hypothetical protein